MELKKLLEFSIINVDKPAGLTSFKVADKVRKILKVQKTGHFGTLDPMVTGVLPVAINRACKLSGYFMGHDKEYVGRFRVHSQISETDLRLEMVKFVGKIMQKPPVKSRVKRVLRERIVNKFEITKIEGKTVWFHADVQAGTYIRKLISDLGEKIGGAHMISLQRVGAGIFKIEDSVSLEEIERAVESSQLQNILIDASSAIKKILPFVEVKEEVVSRLLNGSPLKENDVIDKIAELDLISVFCNDIFIGIYRKKEKEYKPEFVRN